MEKPILRWTIGKTSKLGYDALAFSIKQFYNMYKDKFDYYLLYNNSNVQVLREIIGLKDINLIKQEWKFNPLNLNYNIDSSFWKLIPARINIKKHEIFIDNDIIPLKYFKKIDEFLNSNKVLLTKDCLKYQGKYRNLFKNDENYNAGFFGLPPYYDFEKELFKKWEENNSYENIENDDEQGLTTATLKAEDKIIIENDEMLMVFPNGKVKNSLYNKETNKNNFKLEDFNIFDNKYYFYHFVTINNNSENRYWNIFVNNLTKRIKNL